MSIFRTRAPLAEHLPWAGLLAPGVVCGTSGALMATLAIRGPDTDSMTDEALAARAEQLNHLFQRYGYGWALHFDAHRDPVSDYPESQWPCAVTKLIDAERAALYADAGEHYVTQAYVTLVMQAPSERTERLWRVLYETASDEVPADYAGTVRGFVEEVDVLEGLLRAIFAEVRRLSDDETLTYLHACCSTKRHPVVTPRCPMFLSHTLADEPLKGGEQPILGDAHLRVISVKSWPHGLWPGVLGVLGELPIQHRCVVRWLPIDKGQALKVTHKAQRNWLQKRKRLLTMLREEVMKRESAMIEADADGSAADAVAAQAAVAAGEVSLGALTLHIVVWDTDRGAVNEKVAQMERALNGEGFTTTVERQHAVEGWFATQPGNLYEHTARSPVMSSNNLVDLAPTSAIWTGAQRNAHLGGPPLAMATTGASTPFGVALHDGDVGHSLFVGPSGMGKDTLLWFLAAQFARYAGARVRVFDKGHGSRCMTAAIGGGYEGALGQGARPAQPLREIDQHSERVWAAGWLADIVSASGLNVTPAMHETLWEALGTLAGMREEHRTMTALCIAVQDETLREALRRYTLDGAYGMLLDGDEAEAARGWWHTVALDSLLTMPDALPAVMAYQFHRIERELDGAPTLIIFNEFGEYLEHPMLVSRIQHALTQVRKLNASIWLATQSIQHLTGDLLRSAGSDIPNRVYLPNIHATEEETAALYARWGVNTRQRTLIAAMIPKKHYYLCQRGGSRVIDFQLGPVALAFSAAGSAKDLARMDAMLDESPQTFAAAWLRVKGLGWAADALTLHEKEMEYAA